MIGRQALGCPLFRGPFNAHVTLQLMLQRTMQGAIQQSKPPSTSGWMKSKEGAGWQRTVGPGPAAPAMLGFSERSERKRIKTCGGLLGLVVYEVLYHRWA